MKKIFNQESDERFDEARILTGNPNGIFNFNKTNHRWAKDIYDKMKERTWFPAQVSIIKDISNYPLLSEDKKRAYDLMLAQLIANDSLQTNQLMDRINSFITSSIVNACLSVQAMEEANHAFSYAVMAEDICQDTDRIYNLHKEDEELAIKNKAVEDMYEGIYKEDNSIDDKIMALVGNQILEELVFPGGFAGFFSLDNEMPGTAAMISEIQKDETLSHVHLFKNIFRTAVDEEYGGVLPTHLESKIKLMIETMVNAEIRWTKYVAGKLPGFSNEAIRVFIEGQGNSVCKNLRIEPIYEVSKINPLRTMVLSRLKGGTVSSRTNFFEIRPVEYNSTGLIIDI